MWRHFAKEAITDVFSEAKLNLQIYQMAVSDHIDDREKRQKKKNRQAPEPKAKAWPVKHLVAQLQTLEVTKWIFSFLLLLAMLVLYKWVFADQKHMIFGPDLK